MAVKNYYFITLVSLETVPKTHMRKKLLLVVYCLSHNTGTISCKLYILVLTNLRRVATAFNPNPSLMTTNRPTERSVERGFHVSMSTTNPDSIINNGESPNSVPLNPAADTSAAVPTPSSNGGQPSE